VVSRQTSAKRGERKRDRKKVGREEEGNIKMHFYYNITNPLIALITPKGKQNSSAGTKCMNN